MTVNELVEKFKRLKPHQMSEEDILAWITNVDQTVVIETLQKRTTSIVEMPVYTKADDTVLLIPSPFADAYIYYLAAMVDFWTLDMNGYNNSLYAYNTMLSNYKDYYNRNNQYIGSQAIRT